MTSNKGNIPFKAALFDLDGTLLDSMYVWAEVDRKFFAEKQLEMPEDYPRALSGLSYRESAEYTKRRFGLSESWQEIVETWTRMSRDEYHRHVRLKPGSLEYLQYLKSQGVKLAVTTSLLPELYQGCLKNNGVYDMFDVFCSTRERSKADGALFLQAAEQLGVRPEDCVVFEDVYEGILGAKRAGMRAYCIRDASASHAHDRIDEIADGMLDCILEMGRVHAIPQRCVIFSAVCRNPELAYAPQEGDYVLCADAGYRIARHLGVQPDLVLGDFDSSDAPDDMPVARFPVEKDDTDTMLCLRHALNMGYRRILMVGGLGGRFDHSMANVQSMLFAARSGAQVTLDDGVARLHVLIDGTMEIRRERDILSVFALDRQCRGITLKGLKYPLEDGSIENSFPIGCSNHFEADVASISVKKGALLLVEEYEK